MPLRLWMPWRVSAGAVVREPLREDTRVDRWFVARMNASPTMDTVRGGELIEVSIELLEAAIVGRYAKPAPKSRRRRSGKKPGKQPGTPGKNLAQIENPTRS